MGPSRFAASCLSRNSKRAGKSQNGMNSLGMSALPLRFLTPFPHRFSRRCGTPNRLGCGIRQPAQSSTDFLTHTLRLCQKKCQTPIEFPFYDCETQDLFCRVLPLFPFYDCERQDLFSTECSLCSPF